MRESHRAMTERSSWVSTGLNKRRRRGSCSRAAQASQVCSPCVLQTHQSSPSVSNRGTISPHPVLPTARQPCPNCLSKQSLNSAAPPRPPPPASSQPLPSLLTTEAVQLKSKRGGLYRVVMVTWVKVEAEFTEEAEDSCSVLLLHQRSLTEAQGSGQNVLQDRAHRSHCMCGEDCQHILPSESQRSSLPPPGGTLSPWQQHVSSHTLP